MNNYRTLSKMGVSIATPVVILDLEGNFLNRYDSIKKCADSLGLNRTTVSTNLTTGKLRLAKKYIVRYEEDYDPNIKITYKSLLNRKKLMNGECQTVIKRNIRVS